MLPARDGERDEVKMSKKNAKKRVTYSLRFRAWLLIMGIGLGSKLAWKGGGAWLVSEAKSPTRSTFSVAHQPSLSSTVSWSCKHQKLPGGVLLGLPRGFRPSSGLSMMQPILCGTVR